ncbi:GntR family transcriptional regulator [Streptomyces sp. NPDC021224]|uniref:GntR family transcriptional regulator n=1 Tax=unclassified Streptomyces TaxID=2593676 RepID=UPI0037A74CBC
MPYQRIARELREQIEAGRYGAGERLPGENDLMARYGVARMTARQAFGVMQAEGVAEARKGAGVFVRGFRPVRRRRFVLDGKPVLLATSYFPARIVTGPRVTEEDTGPGGVYARLAELGYEPVRFREEVRARMPSGEEARRLELRAGTPVVLVCRTAYTGDGTPVEVNEMVLDSAAYVLEYAFGS